MKRNLFLATVAAMSLVAVPAMAQSYGRAHKRNEYVRPAPAMPSISSYAPHSAMAGQVVTISGDDFVAGTKVMLGNTIIAPTTLNARRIKFTIPSGASDGRLSLVLPGRRGSLSVGSFNVIVPPPPKKYGNSYGNSYDDSSWSKTRRTRRTRTRQSVLNRWDRAFLSTAAAKAELELHAERTARLNRMSRLARFNGNARLVTRINIALSKENKRHDSKMAQLKNRFELSLNYNVRSY